MEILGATCGTLQRYLGSGLKHNKGGASAVPVLIRPAPSSLRKCPDFVLRILLQSQTQTASNCLFDQGQLIGWQDAEFADQLDLRNGQHLLGVENSSPWRNRACTA